MANYFIETRWEHEKVSYKELYFFLYFFYIFNRNHNFWNKKIHSIVKITGQVEELRKNSILITDDKSPGDISIAYSQLSGDLDLQVGDRVEIQFEGLILESAPAQINDKNGVKIKKILPEKARD